ncbi:hypothetical protein [Mycobacterium lepromatosis]|nr:hypothetical protein [Mycobacterium lepromatosis]
MEMASAAPHVWAVPAAVSLAVVDNDEVIATLTVGAGQLSGDQLGQRD